jgi:hypothetical protein
MRSVLSNAIGVTPTVAVELARLTLRAGDRLLLCSDGLHDYFMEDTEVVDRLGAGRSASACRPWSSSPRSARPRQHHRRGDPRRRAERRGAGAGRTRLHAAGVERRRRRRLGRAHRGRSLDVGHPRARHRDHPARRRGRAAARTRRRPAPTGRGRHRTAADRAAGKATDSAEAKTVEQPAVSPELVTALEATAPAAADATTPPPLGTGAPKAPPDATTTLPRAAGAARSDGAARAGLDRWRRVPRGQPARPRRGDRPVPGRPRWRAPAGRRTRPHGGDARQRQPGDQAAWDGAALVGLARSMTDFVYATYLSDLAVDVRFATPRHRPRADALDAGAGASRRVDLAGRAQGGRTTTRGLGSRPTRARGSCARASGCADVVAPRPRGYRAAWAPT